MESFLSIISKVPVPYYTVPVLIILMVTHTIEFFVLVGLYRRGKKERKGPSRKILNKMNILVLTYVRNYV